MWEKIIGDGEFSVGVKSKGSRLPFIIIDHCLFTIGDWSAPPLNE